MEWPNRMAAEANSLRTVGFVFGLYTLSPSDTGNKERSGVMTGGKDLQKKKKK
jgi:hypothetical protein